MREPDYSKALHHSLNVTLGVVIGGLASAHRNSAANNLLWSAGLSVVGSGLGTLLNSQRFFSKETLVDMLVFTASSAAMHSIMKSAYDERPAPPKITFSPDCACKQKSWAAKVSGPSAQAEMSR